MPVGPAIRKARRKGVSVRTGLAHEDTDGPDLFTYSRQAADKLLAYRLLVDRVEALLQKHPQDPSAVAAALRQIDQFDREIPEPPQW